MLDAQAHETLNAKKTFADEGSPFAIFESSNFETTELRRAQNHYNFRREKISNKNDHKII
jgi:hypothetical protein